MYHLQSMTKRPCCQEVQRELIRAQIQQLIAQLHELGKEECFMVSACVRSSSYSLLGSPKGQEYMQELWSVQSGFLPYLQKVENKGVSLRDVKTCLPSASADYYQAPEMTDCIYDSMCIVCNSTEGGGHLEDIYTPIELEIDIANINQCISSEIEFVNNAVVSNKKEVNGNFKQCGEVFSTYALAHDSEHETSDSPDMCSFLIADDALVKQELSEDYMSVSSDSEWDDEDDIQEIGTEEIQQILTDMSKLGRDSTTDDFYQSTNTEMQDSKSCVRMYDGEVKVKEELCTAEDQKLFAITNVQGDANSIYQIQYENNNINNMVHDVPNVKLELETSIDHEIKLKQKLEKYGTSFLNTNQLMQLIPKGFNMCSFCNKHLRCIKERMEHESQHTKAFKCFRCDVKFEKREQLRRHVTTCLVIPDFLGVLRNKSVTVGNEKKQIIDNSVGFQRDSLKKFEGNQPFYCSNCGKSFKFRMEMDMHICKAKETTVSEKHITKSENDTKSFIHNKSVTLRSSQGFRRHISYFKTLEQCNELRKFKCVHCGKAFLKSCKLVDHVACVHTREMRFKCSACPKTFMARYQFRRHPKTCSKIYANKCTLQTYIDKKIVDNSIGFPRDSLKKLTIEFEENQPLYCSSCGHSFKFRMEMDTHLCKAREVTVSENHVKKSENETKSFIHNRSVTLRSSQRFRCQVNYFKTLEHYNEYRKFKCLHCGKAFLKSCHLVNHIACVHTRERRFKCSACSKTFMAEYQFKRHLKTCSKIYANTCTIQKLVYS